MSNERFVLQVYVGAFSGLYEALSIEASKQTTTQEIIECIAEKLSLQEPHCYELAEVIANEGKDCKERRIGPNECPVALQFLWPLNPQLNNNFDTKLSDHQNKDLLSPFYGPEYRFCLRRKFMQCMNWSFSWTDTNDSQLLKDYFLRFLYQPKDREYPDLCQLPDLTEQTLLENLKARFEKGHIYTYVGSILIAVNPFKFYPIYNPKYVQLYQNRRLGELPPHIFAIADAAYQTMLRKRCNQCIVISGESGSGKTESTNLLLHHLTALSQKGSHGSGVERTILGAGPVLEAFGNAKTKHNNNSSRFGKFIQVNYKENGMVHGAVVQKYLLEKSRIVSQAKNERNYHVFYYLLAGADQLIKEALHLAKASDYFYLNQSKCYTLEGVDEAYEFSRLKQSLEMVGFSSSKQNRLYAVLSAVLHIGNVEFVKKSTYHADETVMVSNLEEISVISKLLMVKEETLLSALTCKRTKAAKGETIIINYKLADAVATRDAMAKCLYGALFDWIVMQVNQALLTKQDSRFQKENYIGVLDIFGFEDFGDQNYFEQFCINYANEHLHHYFNQHVFKYEQEEYRREGIKWKSIDFHDNQNCLNLIEGRPEGLLCQLDDQCNFPGASNSTVLQKFVNHQQNNPLFEIPPCRQSAFVIKHYAGKVKYQIKDFREKNLDLMRPDIVSLLKSSYSVFVRELVGSDPLSFFRWQILKAFFKAYFVFTKLREQSKQKRAGIHKTTSIVPSIKSSKLNNFEIKQRKNKFRPSLLKNSNRVEKSIKSLKTLKLIVGKNNNNLILNRSNRKHTSTVTAQFQSSLNQLMETLNQANPFFVRCIKSNPDKAPHCFDDMLVLVQLRYTGMLETVTIRQAGYSVRLSFEEFIQHYRILLPKGLLSSQVDVKHFLDRMNLNRDNYQIGLSKIFMRESEKSALDDMLHQEILRRIITLQKCVRTWITQKRFQQMRQAALIIQTYVRRWLAQQRLSHLKWIARCEHWGATIIQKNFRCYKERKAFLHLKNSTIIFQAFARGFLSRKRFKNQLSAKSKTSNSSNYLVSNLDSQSSPSDEAFLSKSSSQEELELSRLPSKSFQSTTSAAATKIHQFFKDSEESSGVHEDSETESLNFDHTHNLPHQSSPPPLPPRRQPPSSFLNSLSLKPIEKFEKHEKLDRFERLDYHSQKTDASKVKNENLSTFKNIEINQNFEKIKKFDNFEQNRLATNIEKLESPLKIDTLETVEQTEITEKEENIKKSELFHLPSKFFADLEKPSKSIKPSTFCEEMNDKPRLDRRRNRPLRKLSLKRSKSNKLPYQSSIESEKVSKSTSDIDIQIAKKPVKEMISESSLPSSQLKPLPKNLLLPEGSSQLLNQKGAFQKAKKHFRTFITGSSNKLDKKYKDTGQGENDYHQAEEENYNLLNSSHIKSKKSKPSPLYSSLLPTILTSTNYTLLTRHNLKSALSFQKSDICALCESNMCQKTGALSSGFKCYECQLFFHTSCLSNANQVPCIDKTKLVYYSSSNLPTNPSRPPRNKYRNKSAKTLNQNDINNININLSSPKNRETCPLGSSYTGVGSSPTSSWNVTRTTEFIDPKDILITDVTELHYMEIFINTKIRQMEESKKTSSKESMVDIVFKIALKEFKSNLLSTYSVASQDGRLHLTYKNLIDHFGQVILNVCQQENTYKSFPVIMGVNAFRGFLDEFRNLGTKVQIDEKSKSKNGRRKRNKKKELREEFIYKCDHKFASIMANIPTVCEVCSTLMWLTEKIWVCQRCKFTCHKRCTSKLTVSCRDKVLLQNSKRLFGAPLENLITEEMRVPPLLDNLITAIELKGLYTEGIYRKSGASSKITELKNKLEENVDNVDLDSYSVHVLSAVLKSFLREMPNPLMTYELYDDFLWTTAISDSTERVQAIYSHIIKLPRVHYDVLERLIFHLARVAQQESANRMNANSLAIVFAPCILRTDKIMQMQDKLCDISKQTICIETIINDRLKQVKDTLADIEILDCVYHTTSSRLSSLKMSKSNLARDNVSQTNRTCQPDEEEELTQQIDLLEQEKAHLTIILPSFRLGSVGSDEDLLASNEIESPICKENLSLYSLPKIDDLSKKTDFEFPIFTSRSQKLRHLTKHRVFQSPQNRRLPSRFSKLQANNSTQNGLSSSLKVCYEISKEPKRDLTSFKNDDNSY